MIYVFICIYFKCVGMAFKAVIHKITKQTMENTSHEECIKQWKVIVHERIDPGSLQKESKNTKNRIISYSLMWLSSKGHMISSFSSSIQAMQSFPGTNRHQDPHHLSLPFGRHEKQRKHFWWVPPNAWDKALCLCYDSMLAIPSSRSEGPLGTYPYAS